MTFEEMPDLPVKKTRMCRDCEHRHPAGVECQKKTPAQHSSFAPKCGCTS